jgi:hypothetical protein
MRGAIPPLPHTPSCRVAWLSTGTTLPFTFTLLREPGKSIQRECFAVRKYEICVYEF